MLLNQWQTCERFTLFVIQHFIEDDCTYLASALAFATLLAVVPLMSVGLAMFSSFPVFQEMAGPIQNFIFENFVPATGKVVQTYLQQFTSQVTKLSAWGVVFLVISAILVMFTIERAMNKIWRVSTPRRGISAFLLYWAILSLTPILLVLSLATSSYFFSLPLLKNNYAPIIFLHYAPILLSLTGFTFLYILVPNCPVKIQHAIWGGLFAATSFEIAKVTFANYLIRYNTYELLYGAFATVPIFFIWVYWVWIITLLGAEISFALSVHHQRRRGTALDGFSHALLWLDELWIAQHKGKGLSFNELIDASKQPFAVDADEMIHTLIKSELIHATADGYFMLSRDLGRITLYDLAQILPYRLPTYLEIEHSKTSSFERWRAAFKKNNEVLKNTLNMNLEELFKKNGRR